MTRFSGHIAEKDSEAKPHGLPSIPRLLPKVSIKLATERKV